MLENQRHPYLSVEEYLYSRNNTQTQIQVLLTLAER